MITTRAKAAMHTQTGSILILLVGLVRPNWADEPHVEVEEALAPAMEAHNGAGPLWCYGAPLLVRVGDDVLASVLEVGAGVPPPGNTRWRLLRRGGSGWAEVAHAAEFREREPCPLAWSDRLGWLLSVNPPGVESGRCDPHLWRWSRTGLDQPPTRLELGWPGSAQFSEHSYRGLAVDGVNGSVLALNIDNATSDQRWSLLPADGRPGRSGSIRFPVRACYPQVALQNGSGHVLAVGDQVEPNPAWQAFKRAKTGSPSDYVFRQLYYTSATPLESADFTPPIEVDSVAATGGHIQNLDLWVGPDGLAHLLYLKASSVQLLRDEFFPGQAIIRTLEYAVIARGSVVRRVTLITGGEGQAETPQYGRFHATGPGKLHVIAAVMTAKLSPGHLENWIFPVPEPTDARPIHPTRLPLATPLSPFFTATPRGGSRPSATLDLLGQGSGNGDLRYAQIRFTEPRANNPLP